MSESYYNTTHQGGEQLALFKVKAERQEVAIINYWRAHKKEKFHPAQIQQRIETLNNAPLTSIRRAFTNLSKTGNIKKTDFQVKGPYSRPTHLWEYVYG